MRVKLWCTPCFTISSSSLLLLGRLAKFLLHRAAACYIGKVRGMIFVLCIQSTIIAQSRGKNSRHFILGYLAAENPAARIFFLQQDFEGMDLHKEKIFFYENCCARVGMHDIIVAQASAKSCKKKNSCCKNLASRP